MNLFGHYLFFILLGCIAILPLANKRWWEKNFIRLLAENHGCKPVDECREVQRGEMSPQHVGGGPRRREAAAGFSGTTAVKPWGSIFVSFSLAFLIVLRYVFQLKDAQHLVYTGLEYFSSICLIGSLFVVSGGIHINVKGEATPVTNSIFLVMIIGSVFINHPRFLREGIMLLAAVLSYLTTPKPVHESNDFNFGPIKEVIVLFMGIFATMIPALAWLEKYAAQLGIHTPGQFFLGERGVI